MKKVVNMKKKLVRLTENDLRRIVETSVSKVLSEDYVWWGDDKPVKDILSSALDIVDRYRDYDFDDCESTCEFDLYSWAKRVADEAETFLHRHSYNTAVG